ncbi:MAG TPA: AI-2E family transporter [Vitreimonas sp.]|nr:AI-2E family transporter [Vitreimonas sp.]
MAIELTHRQRRWLDALLILATVAVAFVVASFVGQLFFFFGDILLVFFLAWLLAFILSPLVRGLTNAIPLLPYVVAVILIYSALLGGLVVLTVVIAGALASSIADFAESVPTLQTQLPEILAPWQRRLDDIGLQQVDLIAQAQIFLGNLNRYAEQLAEPLRQVAVASLGAIGNLLFILILSLYMVIDRDRVVSFLFRIVPPGFKDEARLLETSVARSFGGFLRGQAVMGVVYGLVAVLTSAALGLPYLPVTAALSGLLHAIPFFGPFVSWAPPVLVAILVVPDATVPALIGMMIGWFLVMNALQPRLMSDAVGIHPIVVLGSVLVGSKIAGITGAIFGIPVAAVLSAFFFHYLGQNHENGPVTARAARRLEARKGRRIRVPREPDPEVDPDIEEVADPTAPAPPAMTDPATGTADR